MNILLIASSPNDLAIVNNELIQATGPPYTLEHEIVFPPASSASGTAVCMP